MPTTKPRHAITETESVVAALDAAAARWPEDRENRGRLLLRLIEEGRRAVTAQADAQAGDRAAAVARVRGSLAGVFSSGYLAALREDWPE